MLRQVALKELRETLWIAGVALAVYLYFVAGRTGISLLPWQGGDYYGQIVPFVHGGFLGSFALVSVCLAIALGLRQSAVESARGTYEFLLHRPTERMVLIGSKLVVGLALYGIGSAVPILLYAWWAATPGTHASPFEWSMTVPVWKVWISMTILYLGAFLSGIRPARWYGTRLLPLVAAGVLVLLLQFPPLWFLFDLGMVVVLGAVLLGNIFHVARTRDFS